MISGKIAKIIQENNVANTVYEFWRVAEKNIDDPYSYIEFLEALCFQLAKSNDKYKEKEYERNPFRPNER